MSQAKQLVHVYIALMTLLIITIISAFIEMGRFNPVLNIGIAVAKTVLIVIFFMHLKQSSALVRLFAVAGLFWLALLFGLTMSDYLTRP